MEITNLLVDSFWHSEENGSIQIRSVNLDTNEVTYIAILGLDDAYDDTRGTITESFDSIQTKWAISDYDSDRIAAGLTNEDVISPSEIAELLANADITPPIE